MPSGKGFALIDREAAACVTAAFYHFNKALMTERTFDQKYGGHWILPDAEAESDLANAMHRIRLFSPQIERIDSYMRRFLEETACHELDGFLPGVFDSDQAIDTLVDWQSWASGCSCDREYGKSLRREMFPTQLHPGISDRCEMHRLVQACHDYCIVLDDAWDQIADWYHDQPIAQRRRTGTETG